jgi:hypothetical protein
LEKKVRRNDEEKKGKVKRFIQKSLKVEKINLIILNEEKLINFFKK